jgi:outer membrane protein insertion porin family
MFLKITLPVVPKWMCLFLLAMCLPYAIFGQDGLPIRKITFKGNRHLSKNVLQEQLTISSSGWVGRRLFGKQVSWYSEQALNQNVDRLVRYYQKEGFLNPIIDTAVTILQGTKPQVKVLFSIDEGAYISVSQMGYVLNQVDSVELKLSRIESMSDGLAIKTQVGKRFRDSNLLTDRGTISRIYQMRGYPYATTDYLLHVDTFSHQVGIQWQINTGPQGVFGNTRFDGLVRVRPSVVQRQLAFSEGDRYSLRKLTVSQQQIYNLGLFRVASVRAVMPAHKPDTIDVKVNITEAPRFVATYGAGYGQIEKLRLSVQFQFLGFMGGARRFDIKASRSAVEPYNIDFKLSQPAFLHPRGSLVGNPYWLGQDEPGYRLRKYGTHLGYTHLFSKRFSSSMGFYYENIYRSANDLARSASLKLTDAGYDKSGVLAGMLFDNSLPRFDPSEGFYASAHLKLNGLLPNTDYPFTRLVGELRYYQQIQSDVILASKIKMGYLLKESSTEVRAEDRFYAGGSSSVRGWARHALGPADVFGLPMGGVAHFELSLEPRIRVHQLVTLALFVDAGQVWESNDKVLLGDLQYAAGVGLRVHTPIGPVGVDVARPVSRHFNSWQLGLNIGHPF